MVQQSFWEGESLIFLEILVEGGADVPTIQEVLERRFNLVADQHFRIHPHQGKGQLPANPMSRPDSKRRGLLDQLPAKLRGYAHLPKGYCVIVVLDADDDECKELKTRLVDLYHNTAPRPACILFRLAIEEIESWFLADEEAILRAYSNARVKKIPNEPPDSVIGAWECLAEVLGRNPNECTGSDKREWGKKIAPHLNLDDPKSPSLRALINGIKTLLEHHPGIKSAN
jgi:hypothetical protein